MVTVSAVARAGIGQSSDAVRRCHGGTKGSHQCQQVTTSPPAWQLPPTQTIRPCSLAAVCRSDAGFPGAKLGVRLKHVPVLVSLADELAPKHRPGERSCTVPDS